jgi:hypothetical protein
MAPVVDQALASFLEADYAGELWRRGDLRYLLCPHELSLYALIRQGLEVAHCTRGYGKTKSVMVYCLEEFLRDPARGAFPFVTADKSKAAGMLKPLVRWLAADAPDNLRPEWSHMDGGFRIGDREFLKVYGSDREQYDALRGTTIARKVVIDEAGFCDNLKEIMVDVISPACRKGGGSIVILSTSPYSTDHYFWTRVDMAQKAGTYARYTLDDNTLWTRELKEKALAEVGGPGSITAQREYYCKRMQEKRRGVIPEMTEDVLDRVLRPWDRPTHYRLYAALDPGTVDGTGYVLGYWDFEAAKLIIDGCWSTLEQNTTADIHQAIVELETQRHPEHEVHERYSDTARQMIIDLSKLHGLKIRATKKDNLEMQVNAVRMLIDADQLVITPEAAQVARELLVANWDKNGTTWQRSDAYGHFNLLAAVIYLVRNVDRRHNPFPVVPAGVDGRNARIYVKSDDERRKRKLADIM